MPWGELGVDVVIEATGRQRSRQRARAPPRRRRQARHPLRAASRRARRHAWSWASTTTRCGPSTASSPTPRCTAHAAAPVLAMLAASLRHRARLPHHRARLHQPAAAGRRAGRGHAHRPRRRREHHPAADQRRRDARWSCCPSCAAGSTGMALNVPVPNGSVVDLVCWHERAGHRRRRSTRRCAAAAAGELPAASSTSRTSRSSRATSCAVALSGTFDARRHHGASATASRRRCPGSTTAGATRTARSS